MITDANVESLRNEISAFSNMEDAAIIFDLFGNSSYRFQHVDGTLVLPIRVGGGTIYWAMFTWFPTQVSASSSTWLSPFSLKPVHCSLSSCPPYHATSLWVAAGTPAIPQMLEWTVIPVKSWILVFISERSSKPLWLVRMSWANSGLLIVFRVLGRSRQPCRPSLMLSARPLARMAFI
jgi:hypothetical protein